MTLMGFGEPINNLLAFLMVVAVCTWSLVEVTYAVKGPPRRKP